MARRYSVAAYERSERTFYLHLQARAAVTTNKHSLSESCILVSHSLLITLIYFCVLFSLIILFFALSVTILLSANFSFSPFPSVYTSLCPRIICISSSHAEVFVFLLPQVSLELNHLHPRTCLPLDLFCSRLKHWYIKCSSKTPGQHLSIHAVQVLKDLSFLQKTA